MKNDEIYVFGHRHPDTDSICSAIAYADLKNKLGINAKPMRLGEINKETAFVLDYFNVPVPEFLETVKTQVQDLQIDNVEKVSPSTSVKMAWELMAMQKFSTLPVVDDNEKLLGLVSLSDITRKYMDVFNYNVLTSMGTTLDNITETLNAEIILGENDWFNSAGKVIVAAASPAMLSEYMENGDLVIVGDREETQSKAIDLGASCLVLTCGTMPSEKIKEKATEKQVIILSTGLDTYATVRLINQSIPVGSIMCKDTEDHKIVKFKEKDYIDTVKESMLKNKFRGYPVVDAQGHVSGLMSRYHLISPMKKRVIMVDHNEKQQTCQGIEEAEVLEIIDHHKVGDMTTTTPILFKNEPVGSTATIVANMFSEMGRRPSQQIAGILCAAIISDTLKFESPTATDYDRRTADKLAAIAGININEFAGKMFTAGSELKGKTPQEIYSQDFKRISFSDYRIGISQITILNMDYIMEEKKEILGYMEDAADKDNFDLLGLLITELSTRRTEFWLSGKLAGTVLKELSAPEGQKYVEFSRLMSRKKDIIPLIDTAIEKIDL